MYLFSTNLNKNIFSMFSNRMIIIQNDGTTLFVHPCRSDYTYIPISLIILDSVLSMYWFSSRKLPPTLLISVQLAVSSFWLLMPDHNITAFLFHTFLFHFRCIFCPYLPIWKVFSLSWLPHNGTSPTVSFACAVAYFFFWLFSSSSPSSFSYLS